jgi:hypothetical protein
MATATAPRLLPEVEKFLTGAPLTGVIGGKDVAAASGETMPTRDPGTGETIAEFSVLGAAEVDAAVKAAQTAFKKSGWATMAPNERGALLHRFADAIEKHKPIIGQIESLDAGKILGQALGDVQNCVDTLRYFADMALHVQRRRPQHPRINRQAAEPRRRAVRGGHGEQTRGHHDEEPGQVINDFKLTANTNFQSTLMRTSHISSQSHCSPAPWTT